MADEAASLSSTLTEPGGAGGGSSDRHVVHLGAKDSDPDETNSRLRRRLRSFWNCHGAGFSEWWLALPEADRVRQLAGAGRVWWWAKAALPDRAPCSPCGCGLHRPGAHA